MKKLLPLLVFPFLLICTSNLKAQNIAINDNGSTPDTSAMLDISSTTKGLLAPRMTTTQQNAIPLPATGLLIFNTTTNTFNVNTGTAFSPIWSQIALGSGGITSLGGQTGATQTLAVGTTGTNFAISSSGNTHTFNLPDAGPSARGVVTTAAQTLAGDKTLSGNTALGGTLAVTGATTLSTLAGGAATDSIVTVVGATGLLKKRRLADVLSGTQTAMSATLPISIVANNISMTPASATDSGYVTINAQTIAGNKTFNGNTAIGGTLGVTGVTTLSNNATVGGTLGVTGVTNLSNNATVGGTFGVTGNTTLSGTAKVVNMAGGAVTDSIVTVNAATGLLNKRRVADLLSGVQTTMTASLPVSITGNNISMRPASATDSGYVTINAQTIAGNKTLSGNTAIGGTLSVANPATLSSTLNVANATTLSSTLNVASAATLSNTLNVAGATTLSTLAGGAATDSIVTVNAATGLLNKRRVADLLSGVQTTMTASLPVSITGNNISMRPASATDSGYVTINAQTIAGNKTLSGNTAIGGTLGVTGVATLSNNATVGGTLSVTGVATLSNNATVGGTLGVTGAATLSNTLAVTGNTTLSGTAKVVTMAGGAVTDSIVTVNAATGLLNKRTVADLLSGTQATMTASLPVSITGNNISMKRASAVDSGYVTTTTQTLAGDKTLSGNTAVGGTLGVTGATTLSSTLGVTGVATLSNNATVGGTLGVTGAATLSNTLAVTGNTILSGTAKVVTMAGGIATDSIVTVNAATGLLNKRRLADMGLQSTMSATLPISITANNISMRPASATDSGYVTINAQTIAGNKTLSGNTAVGGTFGVTGVATLSNNATVGGTLGVTGATTLSTLTGGTVTDSVVTVNASTGLLRKRTVGDLFNGAGWALTGNSGTTAGTNFIGTTDAQDFVVKAGNVERLRVVNSTGDIKIGNTDSSMIRSTKEFIMREEGDEYGPSTLRLRNRNSENGVIFETIGATGGAYLVDYIFRTGASVATQITSNIRFETRSASTSMKMPGSVSEWQFGQPDDVAGGPTLVVGAWGTGSNSCFRLGNLGIGVLTPTAKLDVGGTMNASGATTLASTLAVTGATTLSSTLGVTGVATLSNNATIGGTLGVTGNTTLSGTAKVVTMSGGASTDSIVTVNAATGLLNKRTVADVFSGQAITSLNGLTSAAAPVQTFAVGTTGTNFNISSSTSTHTFNIPDAATGNTRGLITNAAQTIAGAKTFSGAAVMSSTLGVTGVATLSNNATVGGTLGVTGATTLSSTLGVTGVATLSNNATVGGTLGVTGATTLSSTLGVTGVATLSNNATVGGTLGVTGATTLNSTLGVTGTANFSGSVGVGIAPTALVHIKAGTATAGTAPLKIEDGTLLTTVEDGAIERDVNVFYSSVSLLNRGLLPSVYYTVNNATVSLTALGANTAAAPLVTGQRVATVIANTAYEFEAMYIVTGMTATNRTVSTLFAFAGGAAATMTYEATATNAATAGVPGTTSLTYGNSNAATVITPSASGTIAIIKLKGIIRATAAGTITPQIQFSVAPAGTTAVLANSFFKLTPIGSNTVTEIGNWN